MVAQGPAVVGGQDDDGVLTLSKAEQTEVSVHMVDSSLTRFANNCQLTATAMTASRSRRGTPNGR